jgi:GTP-binding protein
MGKEGKFLTSRQILERIQRELQTNIALRFEITSEGQYVLSGRGELHLSVFLENLRREGFELEIGKPKVITKVIDEVKVEPLEEMIIDVNNDFIGAIKSEVGKRRGNLLSQEDLTLNSSRLIFEISTRGILGLRGSLMTLSKGTALMSSAFSKYAKLGPDLQKIRKGVLIATETGKSAPYGLVGTHEKGPVFIGPQVPVYAGMIVGINGRDEDLEINVCREKQLTNNRSSGEDAIFLPPPLIFSMEQFIGFLEDDELLEITPLSLRLRKKILDKNERYRHSKK